MNVTQCNLKLYLLEKKFQVKNTYIYNQTGEKKTSNTGYKISTDLSMEQPWASGLDMCLQMPVEQMSTKGGQWLYNVLCSFVTVNVCSQLIMLHTSQHQF